MLIVWTTKNDLRNLHAFSGMRDQMLYTCDSLNPIDIKE